jgi:ribosome assembly protein 1
LKINHVLEAVNAVIGELFASEVMGRDTDKKPEPKTDIGSEEFFDWSSGLDDADDSDLYFSPDSGNVIFASAVDGWAFGVVIFLKSNPYFS